MTSKDDFVTAWKVRFPSVKPPDLDCLESASVDTDNCHVNLDQVREEKKNYEANVQTLKNELYQHEFIVGFLWEVIHNTQDTDTMSERRDRTSKPPPTAPKMTGTATSMSESDPDLGLDCQVPVDEKCHSEKELDQVPAYMETDIDFDLSNKNVGHSLVEVCDSDPGYLPASLLRKHAKQGTDEAFEGEACHSLDSGLNALTQSDNTVCGNNGGDGSSQLWTKGVDLNKLRSSGHRNNNHESCSNAIGQDSNLVGNKPNVDSTDKNKLTRKYSADSNIKPSSYADHRRELFENQRKSCSTGSFVEIDVNASGQSPPPGGGSFSTFKPRVSATLEACEERKPKPVPTPRGSIGTPEFKVKKKKVPTATLR